MKMRIATHAVDLTCLASPFPASFNGDARLYGEALASLLAITVFGLIVMGWMARDIFNDRRRIELRAPLTAYRLMVADCGLIAAVRSLPQLAFMTTSCERDISTKLVVSLLTFTRYVDVIAGPLIFAWMVLLVLSYPYIVAPQKWGITRHDVIEFNAVWPRIWRSVAIFFVVVAISALMAYGKAHRAGA